MQSKILSRRILFIELFIGFVVSLSILFCFVPKSSIEGGSATPIENTIVSPKQEQPSFGLPVRLKIPVINVDSVVEYVGLTTDGAMGVPKGPDNVAWLKLGTRPGESGSAVIAGHYGLWKNGDRSVFDNLHKLNKGDQLSVEDDKGATTNFVVREIRTYDPNADASAVFSSSDGKSHLNLITCEAWDKVSESYSKRLVVFADKE